MEVKFCFKWNSHLRWLLAGIIAASNFYTETGTVDTKLWEKSILNTLRDLKTAEKKKEYKSVSVYAYSKCIDLLKSSFLSSLPVLIDVAINFPVVRLTNSAVTI